MSPQLSRLPADASVDEASEILDRDGGLIAENLIDRDTLKALWADLRPALAGNEYGTNSFAGQKTKRLSSLFARSRQMEKLALNPLFLGVARAQIQRASAEQFGSQRVEITPNIQVSITQAIQIWPGESQQVAHRDDVAHLLPCPGPTNRVQIMLAMSEFSAENGGTVVYPGSHRWEADWSPKPEEAVAAEMSPGSCLIWVGGLYHRGGPNRSPGPRTGLTMSYVRGNLRQEENQYLAVPREILREYPEELQRLLGYDICPPNLGWVDNEDPHRVLWEDATVS